MEYAQLHTDILADPKLMRAARKGLKGLELTPWFIAFAKAAKDNGRLTVGGEPVEPADLVAQIPGQTSREVTIALKSLESIEVLIRDDDGALRFSAWETRQAKPSSSNEAVRDRVRKHRELKRRNADETPEGSNGGNVTSVTPGNTTTDRRVTERRGEKTERSTEVSSKPPAGRVVNTDEQVGENSDPPVLSQIAGAVRKHWWQPDGKPPEDWSMERELSIWKAEIKDGLTPENGLKAIEGLRALADSGVVDWLKRADKLTGRALFHSHNGALRMYPQALNAYFAIGDKPPPGRRRGGMASVGEVVGSVGRRA